MPEIIKSEPEELARMAHEIITEQEFDYFESESDVREHIAFEELDPSDLSKTQLGYSKIPRAYSEYLDIDLIDALKTFGEPEAQDFLHIDRYAITLGRTPIGDGYDSDAGIAVDLLIPPHGRSCSLRLGCVAAAKFSLQPKQGKRELETIWNEPLELPLGKNVLLAKSFEDDYGLAVYDSLRDWERVLIVGESAIRKYVHTGFNEKDEFTGQQLGARIGQVGYILALQKALGFDTGFEYGVLDPETATTVA